MQLMLKAGKYSWLPQRKGFLSTMQSFTLTLIYIQINNKQLLNSVLVGCDMKNYYTVFVSVICLTFEPLPSQFWIYFHSILFNFIYIKQVASWSSAEITWTMTAKSPSIPLFRLNISLNPFLSKLIFSQ